MKNHSIWDILTWIALGTILAWAVLKSIGAINSPPWQEMIPVFGAVFVAGRIVQIISDVKNGLSGMNKRMDRMATGLTRLETKFEIIESGCKLFNSTNEAL